MSSIDPETVTLMSTYRVGFMPPAPGSLSAGELYIEVDPAEGGAPRLWVGTMKNTGFPGDAISLVPDGIELVLPVVPVNVDVPYLDGTPAVGEILSCTMGNWDGEPVSYSYQWLGDGTRVLPGVGPTYGVLPSDAGTEITCVVTASNTAGSATAPPSNAISIPA